MSLWMLELFGTQLPSSQLTYIKHAAALATLRQGRQQKIKTSLPPPEMS